ncbi:hypothetical protein WN943_012643 [Citrus x changshan-huyou]
MPSQFGAVERGNVKNVLPSGKKKMSQQLANTGLNKKIKCNIKQSMVTLQWARKVVIEKKDLVSTNADVSSSNILVNFPINNRNGPK